MKLIKKHINEQRSIHVKVLQTKHCNNNDMTAIKYKPITVTENHALCSSDIISINLNMHFNYQT